MTVIGLVALGALVVLAFVVALVLRRRRAGDEPDAVVEEPEEREATEPGTTQPASGRDPIELPPAAIRVAVDGRDPWEPARAFSRELCHGEHEPSVEMDDLVVLRDAAREPLVIREVPGHADEVLITTTPSALSDALETLVRTLLSEGYSIERTQGRAIILDREGQSLALTVEQPASV